MPASSIALVALCADWGRVDESTLPQQTRMELLMKDIDDTSWICGPADNPQSITEWLGVKCNSNNEVTDINLYFVNLHGEIDIKWLPDTVERCSLWNNELTGSVNLTALPPVMITLELARNYLSGSIDLTGLPGRMKWLKLQDNKLSGSLDLTKLPSTMTLLCLETNRFEGIADFSRLPESLEDFDVSNNAKLAGHLIISDVRKDFRASATKVTVTYECAAKCLTKIH